MSDKKVEATPAAELKLEERFYGPTPTPLTYCILSEKAYYDKNYTVVRDCPDEMSIPVDFSDLCKASENPKRQQLPIPPGTWKVIGFNNGNYTPATSEEFGFRYTIFQQDWNGNKQVVIAFCGSDNVTSWLTDFQAVVLQYQTLFIQKTAELTKSPLLHRKYEDGYRITVAGHSLGGFLCQVFMMWALQEHIIANPNSMPYAERMSAVVFDSPGAVEFLTALSPNLQSHKMESLKIINHLRVNNFCPMPTPVSTYGTHAGAVWHIPSVLRKFPLVGTFVTSALAHKFVHIYNGFSTATGAPLSFRQMIDWPEANYGAESIAKSAAASVASVIAGFASLAAHATGLRTISNWFKGVAKDTKTTGEFSIYLSNAVQEGFFPGSDDPYAKAVETALTSHYRPADDAKSRRRIPLKFFDSDVATYLAFVNDNKSDAQTEALVNLYGSDGAGIFFVFTIDKKVDVLVLTEGDIFDFQTKLYSLLMEKGMLPHPGNVKVESDGGRVQAEVELLMNRAEGDDSFVLAPPMSEAMLQRAMDLGELMPNLLSDAVKNGGLRELRFALKVGSNVAKGKNSKIIIANITSLAELKDVTKAVPALEEETDEN